MKVLLIGKDPSLLQPHSASFSRHAIYAEHLRTRFPGSEIKIVTYSQRHTKRDRAMALGLCVYGTRSRYPWTFPFGFVSKIREMIRDEWLPDVVSTQSPLEDGLLGYVCAKALKAKFVPQLHFDLFAKEWRAEKAINRLRYRLACWILKRSDAIRVVSPHLGGLLEDRLNIADSKICYAPVAVNFKPEKRVVGDARANFLTSIGLDPSNRVVVYVGDLYAPKNLWLWVEVAQYVLQRSAKVSFLVVGDGPARKELERHVGDTGMRPHVRFIGRQPYNVVPKFYSASDIFLLTSHYEGFGRVIVEALFAGVAVVTTACGGPEGIIEHGVNGLVAPKNDKEALGNAVLTLLADQPLREKFSERGYESVRRAYDADTLTSRIIECWSLAFHGR